MSPSSSVAGITTKVSVLSNHQLREVAFQKPFTKELIKGHKNLRTTQDRD